MSDGATAGLCRTTTHPFPSMAQPGIALPFALHHCDHQPSDGLQLFLTLFYSLLGLTCVTDLVEQTVTHKARSYKTQSLLPHSLMGDLLWGS